MKKTIVFVLLLAFLFSFASCGKKEPVDTIVYTKAPVVTQETTVPTVKPEPIRTYTPKSMNPKESAKAMGYAEGTYEFEYMEILSGISIYTRLAKHGIENLEAGTDAFDHYISRYFETVDKTRFSKPYESILDSADTILEMGDFSLFPLTVDRLFGYWKTREYKLLSEEIQTCVALSFDNIADSLQVYAERLWRLSAQYPYYTGDFAVTDKMKEEAKRLMDACQPVMDEREELFATWQAFYDKNCPAVTVTETYDTEKRALKLVLTGESDFTISVSGIYIENFQYTEETTSQGYKDAAMTPTKGPVTVYLPISKLMGGYDSFAIKKYGKEGRIFEETVHIETDIRLYYSDEPIRMQNEFLDKALTEHFGGAYSERDLLNIQSLQMDYNMKSDGVRQPNSIQLITYSKDPDKNVKEYLYNQYYDIPISQMPTVIPAETWEDCAYFHALVRCFAYDKADARIRAQEIAVKMQPYEVTKNTWTDFGR